MSTPEEVFIQSLVYKLQSAAHAIKERHETKLNLLRKCDNREIQTARIKLNDSRFYFGWLQAGSDNSKSEGEGNGRS